MISLKRVYMPAPRRKEHRHFAYGHRCIYRCDSAPKPLGLGKITGEIEQCQRAVEY